MDHLGTYLGYGGTLAAILTSIAALMFSRGKQRAELRRADVDTYAAWQEVNDRLRKQLDAQDRRIEMLEQRIDALRKDNADALARIQSLEHDNRVLRHELEAYEKKEK
jgi:septal ring factor EnvC (AmiA/AmiB activator)